MHLSGPVIRALSETIAGAGAHKALDPADSNERVILWNNRGASHNTYKFVGIPKVGWLSSRRASPLPRFAAFKHRGETLSIQFGSGAARISSVQEWLKNLSEQFRPETAGGLDIVLQMNLSGADRHEATIHIAQGTLEVTSDSHADPDVVIDADAEDWLRLVNGEVDPTELFLSGRLLISGDMELITNLANLLGGGDEQSQYSAKQWKLSINYLDMYRLELGRAD
jgi:putative sterol carrier protein